MRCSVLLVCLIGACSNAPKRDDASSMPTPPPKQPGAEPPMVAIETPQGEVNVTVEVVDTRPKIEKGMMFREHLAPDGGMLFLMGGETDHTFYMRNTLIPLDMIFITKDMTIAGIVERAEPRTETLRSVGAPSLYVLEVNGGWTAAHQVKPGAKVRFLRVAPGP